MHKFCGGNVRERMLENGVMSFKNCLFWGKFVLKFAPVEAFDHFLFSLYEQLHVLQASVAM